LKNRNRLAWLLAMLTVFAVLTTACGKKDDNKDNAKTKDSSATTKAGGSTDSTDTTGSTTASSSPAASDADLAKLKGKIDGGGSSFQDTFEQQAISDFQDAVKKAGGSATVSYSKSGSSQGKSDLAAKQSDFAGSDSKIKDEEKASFQGRDILFFPITGGPITVAYNLKGVDQLKLSADTIAKIFQGQVTTWDDKAIKADNPDANLPSSKITVVHRSDGSGTTSNFTKYLVAAAPSTWKLDKGETVNWPSTTQGAEKSTGVTSVIKQTDGAVGYVDLADAAKENLNVAEVKNAAGKFVKPTPDSAKEALAGATVDTDLTYDPLNAKGDAAYPITSPTWILIDAKQSDQAKADLLKAYLTYVLGPAQDQAKSLLYAPLPDDLKTKALAQVDKITVG